MVAGCGRIRQLPFETRARVHSTVQISSLADTVVGLVTNAIDASAGKIRVHLDFSKGYCSILDDGYGIRGEDFELQSVAQLYYTSKDSGPYCSNRRYGRFLAALSNVSLLSITSCHVSETTASTAIFKDGDRIVSNLKVDDQELGGMRHGTRVTVHNLFAKIPVRAKYLRTRFVFPSELDKEFLALQTRLLAIVLATTHDFSLNVSDETHRYTHKACTSQDDRQMSDDFIRIRTVSALFQAGLLDSLDPTDWRHMSLSTPSLLIRACIRLRPAPSKSGQFISVNDHPVPSDYVAALLDPVNMLFDSSSFSTNEELSTCEEGKVRVTDRVFTKFRGGKKSTNRWPMFCVHVDLKNGSDLAKISYADGDELVLAINAALNTLVTEFLQKNGYTYRLEKTTRENSNDILAGKGTSNIDPTMRKWSRVKSGSTVPKDLLSGLPFMPLREPATGPTSVQAGTTDLVSRGDTEGVSVPWTNPRTKNLLYVSSRTGMVVSPATNKTALTSDLVQRTRRVGDVAESLKKYIPSPHFEPPLMSIASGGNLGIHREHEVSAFGHTCSSDSEGLCHIVGSAPPDLTYSNIGKRNLRMAYIHGQVDKKFILASIPRDEACTDLVMIDQHAADERIRVEELFRQGCDAKSVALSVPMNIPMNEHEATRFEHQLSYFQAWGIDFRVLGCRLQVLRLPETIIERCLSDPNLVVNILRTQIWLDHNPPTQGQGEHWSDRIAACPQGVLDMLISRACRSAVMFNDELTVGQCQDLVHRLSHCSFPFQCAHGRPSLTILARLQGMRQREEIEERDSKFGEGWKVWVEQSG